MTVSIQAQVLRKRSAPFTLESLHLDDPQAGEILIRVVATGICHTDIKVSQGYAEVPLPVVLGHEGAGVVERVGAGITELASGDHVIMTFPSCGHCQPCSSHHPAYCDHGQTLTFSCQRAEGVSSLSHDDNPVHGAFFAQSSFASYALATVRNTVKVDKDLPLENLGPLGCGFQTGAGAVLNVMQPSPGQSLAVFGTGNVGLSAIMAAKIAGMDPIMALDIQEQRLKIALELGASQGINLNQENDPVAAIHTLTGGKGVDYSLDTTNQPEVVRQAFESLANRGTCIHSGGGGKDLSFPGSHLLQGRTVTGVLQGDSDPGVFIPQLLEYYRQGKFPFDRLLSFYPLAEINQAVEDMQQGKVVKPVLRM
jgi:aryl-alcohol dehydrogenase